MKSKLKEVLDSLNLEPTNLEETRRSLNLLQKIELTKVLLTYDVPIVENLRFAKDEQVELEELITEISYESKNHGYFRESAEFETTEEWLDDIYRYVDRAEYNESYSKVISSYN